MVITINVNTSFQSGLCASALLLAGALACRASDDIQVYTVPKEHPPGQLAQAQPPAAAPDIPVNSAPIRWSTPSSWRELPADGIRKGSFAVEGENGGQAQVSITSFPGNVGGVLANVNRWRSEVVLPPIGQEELSSKPVTVDGFEGKLFDIAGASARTVVAMIPRHGASWFFKLRGDSATVAAAKPAFLEFLKSVRFGADGAQAATANVPPAGADPHAGLQGIPNPHGDAAPADAAADAPKWSVPAQWVATAPRAMIYKSFSVSGDSDAKAEVTVSFFPGDVGGVLANVNRWRGQLGQPQIEADQLASVTKALDTAAGPATLVDFSGTDSKTGQPARLVAVIVPHGDNTWFYKMLGNGALVENQKDAFVNFVKTVHYP